MIFAIIAVMALSIGIFYLISGSLSQNKRVLVDVVDVLDGRTLEVSENGERSRVILAGIRFPPDDDKAFYDAKELVEDVAKGRCFKMEIFRENDRLKYVALLTSTGDSLNELMLSRGFARFDSSGAGFVRSMIEAENEARQKKLGIWMENRMLFHHASKQIKEDESLEENSRMIDQLGEEEDTPFPRY